MEGFSGPSVATFLELLIVVAAVAVGVRFVRIPYTVALVLAGLGLALTAHLPGVHLTPDVILTVFLPVLLFYGAYELELADLRANLLPVTLLAVPGVVATAGLVGAGLHLAAGLPWVQALLFGTIVAATDPVAVLATFRQVRVPGRLAIVVAGESLFNDGTALVFFTTMLGIATAGTFHAAETVERFVVAVAGGLLLGVAVGVGGGALLQRIDDTLVEMAIMLIMAYGGYLLAERLGVSGPLATVAAGLFLGEHDIHVLSPTTRMQTRAIWEFLDFGANSLLFLLVGLELRSVGRATVFGQGGQVWWSLAVAILAVLLARLIVVWATGLVLARAGHPFPPGWRGAIVWAGLRGAVALAAALSLPADLPGRELLLVLTFGVVLFTIVVQGMTMPWLLAWRGLIARDPAGREAETLLARLHALAVATREVEARRDGGTLSPEIAARLLARYGERRERVRAALATLYTRDPALAAAQEREALGELLRLEHEAAHGYLARRGAAKALEELTAEIERELAETEGHAG